MIDNNDNYFKIPDGDKLVGCAGGRNFLVVCTKEGRVYASGIMLWEHFESCRHNRDHSPELPYSLGMPEGCKARKLFASDKVCNVWVNCEDSEGKIKSFGAGQSCSHTGHGES